MGSITQKKSTIQLDNGSIIVLNLESRLQTIRFRVLANKELFRYATTDGTYIKWGKKVEISLAGISAGAETRKNKGRFL